MDPAATPAIRLVTVHLAVVAPPLPGHLAPLRALAAELGRRGHTITLLGPASAARWWRAGTPGCDEVSGERGRADEPALRFVALDGSAPLDVERTIACMARLRGPFGLGTVLRDVAGWSRLVLGEGPAALEAIGADALLADQTEPAGTLVGRHARLPVISTATTLLLDRDPALPPPWLDWRYDASPRGLARNRGAWRVADRLMRPIEHVLSTGAVRLGIDGAADARAEYPLATIAQGVADLEFPRREPLRDVSWHGVWRSTADDAEPDEELDALLADGSRPRIFCTLGTLQGSRVDLFGRVARVCAQRGARLVIAHGGRWAGVDPATLPGRPVVRAFVDYAKVIAASDVVVTHGGFNTVLQALSAGVPLVLMPLAFEQPGIAARLCHAGVARIASPFPWGSRSLARALAQVAETPVRQRARQIGSALRAAGDVRSAADRVESVLGLRGRSVVSDFRQDLSA